MATRSPPAGIDQHRGVHTPGGHEGGLPTALVKVNTKRYQVIIGLA
jgi:hypothetical protein